LILDQLANLTKFYLFLFVSTVIETMSLAGFLKAKTGLTQSVTRFT